MFEQLGGRKLIISVAVIALGLGVALYMGDLPDNLLQLLEVVTGAFMGSNVVAGIVGARFGGAASVATAPAPEEPEAPPAPELPSPPALDSTSTVSAADAIGAFQQLGALIQQQGEQQKKLLEELSKSSQVSQQALSVVINKLASQ